MTAAVRVEGVKAKSEADQGQQHTNTAELLDAKQQQPTMTAAQDSAAAADVGDADAQAKSKMQRLRAAAELPTMSPAKMAFWLLMAVAVQLSWGLYGVCTRYLQTSIGRPIPTLQLMVALNLIAWPGLIIMCTIPGMIMDWWKNRATQRAAAAAAASNANGKVQVVVGASESLKAAEPEVPFKQRAIAYIKTTGLATAIGGVVSLQALSQVYASRYANAYIAQLVFMFTPLCTAIANRIVLKQPTPPKLWPTLVLSLGGAVMVIVGQWLTIKETSGGAASSSSTGHMVLGIGLALLSTMLLAFYLILIQVTRHKVSGEAVLWGKRNVAVLIFVPLSLAVEGLDWSWVAAMTPFSWGILIFTGLYIYTIANIFLQFCTRTLGATLLSVFMSLRLVASILGSIVLLHEVPKVWLSWLGFAIVIVTMTAFLFYHWWCTRQKQKQKAVAAEELPVVEKVAAEKANSRTAAATGAAAGAAAAAAAVAVAATAAAADGGDDHPVEFVEDEEAIGRVNSEAIITA